MSLLASFKNLVCLVLCLLLYAKKIDSPYRILIELNLNSHFIKIEFLLNFIELKLNLIFFKLNLN